jgi:hypothetical protein
MHNIRVDQMFQRGVPPEISRRRKQENSFKMQHDNLNNYYEI